MTAFVLPPGAEASSPPEWRGLARDEVRLMAVTPNGVTAHRFWELPELLEPGDLVVVNTSATLPARVEARRADGALVPLHVSTQLDDGDWVVELRRPDNTGPDLGAEPGTVLSLPGGVLLRLVDGYPDAARPARLWRARPSRPLAITAYLPAHGHPARREPHDHLGAERPAGAGHLRAARLGRPYVLPVGEREVAGQVAVADRPAVDRQVGGHRERPRRPGPPQPGGVGRIRVAVDQPQPDVAR